MADSWVRVAVPSSTAGPVRRGHPWVYRDGVPKLDPGTPVMILDGKEPIGWGLADEGEIAIRVLGTEVPDRPDVARHLRDAIARAEKLRSRLLGSHTDTWRVVHGEGDGLGGLVIDRYAEVAVVRLYARAWERWLDVIADTVAGLGWCDAVGRRLGVTRVDGGDGLIPLRGVLPDSVVVREGEMRLLVRPAVGQKTGMFIDQREHRALVGRWASGRRVANLFAYHGGFSVAAALGGAAWVVTVDVAPEAIADAKENFRLNGLDPDAYGFEVADAFTWAPRGPLDLLVLDPPSLAHGQRSDGAAKAAYRKLHKHHGASVARDGLLATSSCTSRMSFEAWRGAVEEGLTGAWSWHHVSEAPVDHPVALGHPEGRYLKFGLLRRR